MSQRVKLPEPVASSVDVLIVAAEHSGDAHAARMVRTARVQQPGLHVCALGGPRLQEAGAQLLADLTKGSTMGFAVLAQIGHYRALIAEIVRWVGEHRPRAICFVDSSGLNLRIARELFARGFSAKAGGPTRALYYISPQLWASRAGRRHAMARHLDAVAAIFPFEPSVYADTALPVEFVGHPFLADDHQLPVRYDPHDGVLLLPGSRRPVVRRILPALLEAFEKADTDRSAVVLFPSEEMRVVMQSIVDASPMRTRIALRGAGGAQVGAAAVLTASGTMSLECALAGIPGAITYRTDALTYLLGRMLVRVGHIGIANLLLKEAMYPEYIQSAARPEALAWELRECLAQPQRIERTREQAARLRELLHQPANGTATDWLLRNLG
jgi:lipid-A-disaccharide synthase